MRMNYQKSDQSLGSFEPSIGMMLAERRNRLGSLTVLRQRIKGLEQGPIFSKTSWDELYFEIASVGTSLLTMGVQPSDKLAVLSRNSREMLVFELACMSIGAVSVPIFSEYPPPQVEYILVHSDAKYLAVSDGDHLETVLKANGSDGLKRIFLLQEAPLEFSLNVSAFSELLKIDEKVKSSGFLKFHEAMERVTPQEPCVIMYTSGTTGKPKGVVLTHGNILSQQKALDQLWNLGPADRFLCYLPWHHSFGGLFERFRALYSGATLCLDDSYGRDLQRLIENFKAIKPTVYFSAPRIYQALVTEAKHDPSVESELIHKELKFVFTAAAPLPTDVSQYFRDKGIPVVEGWGLTETSPCCTITSLKSKPLNSVVGHPMPGIELRICESGEILVKGPNVMLGYYKDPERSARILDKSGWLHTGDLGELSDKGLKLKGRQDGVFKLANGEKVSSHLIETELVNSNDYIDSAVAIGVGRNYVCALLFPNFKNLSSWAKEQGIKDTEIASLLKSDAVRTLLAQEIEEVNKRLTEKYARIRAAVVVGRPLSLERSELTPSLKVVRSRVEEHFSPTIHTLYEILQRKLQGPVNGLYLKKEQLFLPSDFAHPMEIVADTNQALNSQPGSGQIIYERNINSVVKRLDEWTIRAEASLVDLNHGMRVSLTIDLRTNNIHSATASILKAPFQICTRTTELIKNLEGIRLERGINRKLLQILGCSNGCTHLYELALNAVRLAFNVRMGLSFNWDEWVSRTVSEDEFIEAALPQLRNSCLPFCDPEKQISK
ncbi:AMP-binding protein [bacterium]|nr:AMP-binding protein [bacterium]